VRRIVRLLIIWLWQWLQSFRKRKPPKPYHRKRMDKSHRHHPRKPPWAKDEVIRIYQDTGLGSRKVAAIFNGLHKAKYGISVEKTYVAEQLRAYRYRANELSKRYKHREPPPLPRNRIWGVDMTGKADNKGVLHTIFGVIDHGSRMALALQTLEKRTALAVLKAVISVVEARGFPHMLKTDNEACFTSRTFRWGVRWLGIRHQRSKPGHPWQNGRIERLFGTLKERLDRLAVFDALGLQRAVDEFTFWYNQARPHQHLDGWTPWEAWHGVNPYEHAPKSVTLFSAWDGLLNGYHMRR
jgi:transposase InsO family protein